MLKNILSRIVQRNMALAGNAALVKLGDMAYMLFAAPTKEKLPKELKALVDTPMAQVIGTNAVLGIAESYGVTANEAVADSLALAAWDKFIMSIGEEKAKEIEVAYNAEVSKVMHNVSKGGEKVFHSGLSGIVGIIQKSEEIKRNTSQGGENAVELTEQGNDTPDVYMPRSKDELKKNEKNLYICPDPLNVGDGHAKQKDKFRPWNAREGFMPDWNGVECCGGCCEKMTGLALAEKKKAEKEAAVDQEKLKKQALLLAKENDLKLLNEQLTKKITTEATFKALVEDDPSNEDTANALKNVQVGIADLNKKIDDLTLEIMTLDEEINGAPGNKTEAKPAADAEEKPAPTAVPAQNASKGNAKTSTPAAARLEHLKNQKKHGK